ncbi:Uncharacterized protein DAT39_014240 [Clarias magur]|uniref:Uncharacterized protein n=1 Tax=Clarias magur TaxID=1594786 RepID=A0A8J4UES2_CLAMG|nr:Uncharacterized protein DAT39_014240 [Clarias magur]
MILLGLKQQHKALSRTCTQGRSHDTRAPTQSAASLHSFLTDYQAPEATCSLRDCLIWCRVK